MFNRSFFETKLGQASIASVLAMTAMIALTSQMNVIADGANLASPNGTTITLVELA